MIKLLFRQVFIALNASIDLMKILINKKLKTHIYTEEVCFDKYKKSIQKSANNSLKIRLSSKLLSMSQLELLQRLSISDLQTFLMISQLRNSSGPQNIQIIQNRCMYQVHFNSQELQTFFNSRKQQSKKSLNFVFKILRKSIFANYKQNFGEDEELPMKLIKMSFGDQYFPSVELENKYQASRIDEEFLRRLSLESPSLFGEMMGILKGQFGEELVSEMRAHSCVYDDGKWFDWHRCFDLFMMYSGKRDLLFHNCLSQVSTFTRNFNLIY